MRKKGSKLRNLMYALPIAAASFLPIKLSSQQMVVNPFVPANENGKEYFELKTKNQRDSLVQDFLNKDWVSEIAPSHPSDPYLWDCTEYTRQLITNNYDWGDNINLYNGYKGENLDSIYINNGTLKDMGKGGLPFMWALISDGEGHDMNAILTGDDAEKWEDWNFVEPQFDQMNIKPGQAYMPNNCEVEIKFTFVKENEIQGKYLSSIPILKFKVENGISKLIWKNENIYLITKKDTLAPEINISSPLADSTYEKNKINLEYLLKDKNLDLGNSYFKLNNEIKYFSDSTGKIPLDSKEGENKLEIYSKDFAGNSSFKTINYSYIPSVGINDIKEKDKANFYPNPVGNTGKFKIENPSKETNIEIYDASGKLVGKKLDKEGEIDFDFSDYKTGTYLYRLTGKGGKVYTGKIIKE